MTQRGGDGGADRGLRHAPCQHGMVWRRPLRSAPPRLAAVMTRPGAYSGRIRRPCRLCLAVPSHSAADPSRICPRPHHDAARRRWWSRPRSRHAPCRAGIQPGQFFDRLHIDRQWHLMAAERAWQQHPETDLPDAAQRPRRAASPLAAFDARRCRSQERPQSTSTAYEVGRRALIVPEWSCGIHSTAHSRQAG